MMKKISVAGAVLLAVTLSVAGCAANSEGANPTASVTTSADASLAGQVPKALRDRGTLIVATSPGAPPAEFKSSNGSLQGSDIDLMNAVGTKLGLKVKFVESTFDNIIPGVVGGKYDIGDAFFTDTKAREKTVDFVVYMNGGSQWAVNAESKFDPADPCGKSVAVQQGSFQQTDLIPAADAKCTAAGKPRIKVLGYADQGAAVNATQLGKADAFLADATSIGYAVKHSGGQLKLVGELQSAAPSGFVLAKENELTPLVQKAVAALIEDSSYKKILDKWGIGSGAISEPTINDAKF